MNEYEELNNKCNEEHNNDVINCSKCMKPTVKVLRFKDPVTKEWHCYGECTECGMNFSK